MSTAKIPTTAEEVIALVGDGGMQMQQLIAHAQAQQAQAIAEAQAQAVAQAQVEHQVALAQHAAAAAAAAADVAAMTDADVHMAAADDASSVLSKVDTSSAMDFMPLSAAAVVIGSPSGNGSTLKDDGGVDATNTVDGPNGNAHLAIKRKSIPLSMKKEAIEWILGPGKGIPSRAEKHFSALNWDVSASSFRKWWKNREKILGDSSHKKRITGGGRKPYLENSEEKLLVIVIQERAKKDRVTRKWIAKTAQHMFQRTNANFKASENWVTKFIRRNGLTLKRSYVTYEQHQQHPQMTTTDMGALAHAEDHGDDAGHIDIDDEDNEEDEDVDHEVDVGDGEGVKPDEHTDGADQDADAAMEPGHEGRKT